MILHEQCHCWDFCPLEIQTFMHHGITWSWQRRCSIQAFQLPGERSKILFFSKVLAKFPIPTLKALNTEPA